MLRKEIILLLQINISNSIIGATPVEAHECSKMKTKKLKEIITQERIEDVLDNMVVKVCLSAYDCDKLRELKQAIYIFDSNGYDISRYKQFYEEVMFRN